MGAAVAAAIPLATQLLGLLVSLAPTLADEVTLVKNLFDQQTDVTPDQQAAIDAALDKVKQQIDQA